MSSLKTKTKMGRRSIGESVYPDYQVAIPGSPRNVKAGGRAWWAESQGIDPGVPIASSSKKREQERGKAVKTREQTKEELYERPEREESKKYQKNALCTVSYRTQQLCRNSLRRYNRPKAFTVHGRLSEVQFTLIATFIFVRSFFRFGAGPL